MVQHTMKCLKAATVAETHNDHDDANVARGSFNSFTMSVEQSVAVVVDEASALDGRSHLEVDPLQAHC